MSVLTNIFYITSVALMIPVMLALLFGLVYTFYLAGIAFHEFITRMKTRERRANLGEALEMKNLPAASDLDTNDDVAKAISLILTRGDDTLLVEKKIADMESKWRTELQKIADLTKYGPALGLMGTLIPLGPALVGLAQGDLVVMSNNMVVAFATTVVGVLISLVALGIHSAKRRWYREDTILLTFAAERFADLPQGSRVAVSDLSPEAA